MANTTQQPSTLSAFSDQLAGVVEQAARSIVTVAARPRMPATGILWRADQETIVLTADHVVEREDDITVILPDKREVKAQLIGRDPSTDLVALRLSDVDLGTENVPAEPAEGLKVGNLVLAIGRPSSDGPRVSFGVVSSIDGPRHSYQGGEIESIIYPDVTLYPGFSGGPLVDLAGKLVGMNTSQLTRANSSAVPVATLRRVANTLITHGRVRRGYLGVGTQQVPLPAAQAQKAGIQQQVALLVVTIEQDSPAEKGGLLIGDQIVALGGQPVTDGETLRAQLGPDRLGQTIAVKVIRGGELKELNVTIAERS
ncbi:MAG TPA: trypsin-like peptidase domain-containing protein [Ktedonobacterales bacterium]